MSEAEFQAELEAAIELALFLTAKSSSHMIRGQSDIWRELDVGRRYRSNSDMRQAIVPTLKSLDRNGRIVE